MLNHPFAPVFDKNSRVLILGSFPSVKSREQMFYYGNPQNRFWKVLAGVFEDKEPKTIDEKCSFLIGHKIALWDVLSSCVIEGSADSSIKNARVNDFEIIFKEADIRKIFLNGKTAEKYFKKYAKENEDKVMCDFLCLPSTSPANAVWSLKRLEEAWGAVKNAIDFI